MGGRREEMRGRKGKMAEISNYMLGLRRYQEDAFVNGFGHIVDLPLSLSLFLIYCMYANLNGCEWDSIEL